VDMMINLFDQHTESRIVQRLFLDTQMQEVVRAYTAEYVQSLNFATEYCESGLWMGQFPYDYAEMEA